MKHHNYLRFCLLAAFLAPVFLFAQNAGKPDLSFGADGEVLLGSPQKSYYGGGTLLLPDGKMLVLGYEYEEFSYEDTLVIFRMLPNGAPDLSFGVDGRVYPGIQFLDGGVNKMALTQDGKIILAGEAFLGGSTFVAFAARLNTDGQVDTSFGQNGITTIDVGNNEDVIFTLLIKPDNKILLGGYTYDDSNDGFIDLLLVQLLPDGTFDPAFGDGGSATTNFIVGLESILSLALQADGKIIALGGSNVGNYDMMVVRFTPEGEVDASFADNGLFLYDNINNEDVAYSVAVQNDQKIVFCGSSFSDGVLGKTTVFRLLPNGSFDPDFGTEGKVFVEFGILEFARALLLQPDGKIVIGAESIDPLAPETGWFWVLRFNTDGTADSSFGDNGRVKSPQYDISPETVDLLLQPDGKIIHTGTANDAIVLWRYQNDLTASAPETSLVDFQLTCAPNPVAQQANLSWVQDATAEVSCDLYDTQGRYIQTVVPRTASPAGAQSAAFQLGSAIPAGNYFLVFSAGNERQVLSMIKI